MTFALALALALALRLRSILLMRRVGHVLQTIICTTSLRVSYFTCACVYVCICVSLCEPAGVCIRVSLTYAAPGACVGVCSNAAFIMCKYIKIYIYSMYLMSHCHIKNATPQRFDHYKGILFHLWTALRSLTKRIQLPKIKYKMNEMEKKNN